MTTELRAAEARQLDCDANQAQIIQTHILTEQSSTVYTTEDCETLEGPPQENEIASTSLPINYETDESKHAKIYSDVQMFAPSTNGPNLPKDDATSKHRLFNNSIPSDQSSSEVVVCAFCRRPNDPLTSIGRFCSKRCVGRNAVWHRENKLRNALLPSKQRKKTFTGKHARKRKTSNIKLPIQRRKTVEESDQDYDPYSQSRRRSSTSTLSGEILYRSIKRFSWEQYLDKEDAVAAPADIFRNLTLSDPYPTCSNKFQVGCLMEAVDPQHQSLITLVSVVNVVGQRLRLHFEGFPSMYDFWVYCNSPFIFPCGFCDKTERSLAPPLGFDAEGFNWQSYARDKGFVVAPDEAFIKIPYENVTGFELFDRVEAVDRQHPELICVASIVDAIGSYVLVHFDGWNSYYDYWALNTSSYMKPVGWCSKNSRDLSLPLDLGEQHFDWKNYLESKNCVAADSCLFSNTHHGFEIGMKLEVVDPRNPILARVSSVVDSDDYRILVHFDGWSDVYDIWVDVDSRDLHPINWSSRTGGVLLTPYDIKEQDCEQETCSVPNCLGHGHIRLDRFLSHHSEFGCPYSLQNLKRDSLPDRFLHAKTTATTYDHVIADANNHTKPDSIVRSKKKRGRPRSFNQLNTSDRKTKLRDVNNNRSASKKYKLYEEASHDIFSHSMLFEAAFLTSFIEKNQQIQQPTSWRKYIFSYPEIKGKTDEDINLWSVEQVSSFVKKLTGKCDCADAFSAQEIDGKAFLMLTQSDITSIMKLKLGPSLKISNAIVSIKQTCCSSASV